MHELDQWLEGFMHEPTGVAVVLLISLLLGLRHASDPDHLAAVTTLIASEERNPVKKASFMGFLWGLGHGTTLVVIGLPLVLAGEFLPERIQQVAEIIIGGIIVFLAIRLLLRWRRGLFHTHTHAHGNHPPHRHVHAHAEDPSHEHQHETFQRTPLSAYGIGLVHGIGGSGGITLLLISTIPDKSEATIALLTFAAGTAISMALLSTGFGYVLGNGPVARNIERVVPVLGVGGMAFGAWYALGAMGMITYPF